MFFITPTFNTFCLSLIDGIVFYAVMTIFQAYNDLFELKINTIEDRNSSFEDRDT